MTEGRVEFKPANRRDTLNPAPCEKMPIWITLAMGFRAASMPPGESGKEEVEP
jgi:hypothetical protein